MLYICISQGSIGVKGRFFKILVIADPERRIVDRLVCPRTDYGAGVGKIVYRIQETISKTAYGNPSLTP
jgi:hypothetical protein